MDSGVVNTRVERLTFPTAIHLMQTMVNVFTDAVVHDVPMSALNLIQVLDGVYAANVLRARGPSGGQSMSNLTAHVISRIPSDDVKIRQRLVDIGEKAKSPVEPWSVANPGTYPQLCVLVNQLYLDMGGDATVLHTRQEAWQDDAHNATTCTGDKACVCNRCMPV